MLLHFTPPLKVRVLVAQYSYIIIHLTICQHFFSILIQKNTLSGVFSKSKLGDHGGIRTRDCQDENLES